MRVHKVAAMDELFSRPQIHEPGGMDGSENYPYFEADGWHFYSYLKIRSHLIQDASLYDNKRLVSIYKNYTYAAVIAARNADCCILEHQGNIIHFFFPGADSGKAIYPFAKKLTALVEDHVLGFFEKDVASFNMATEYGKSVIVSAQSPTGKESERSIVSLGPCANNPAKQMIKRIDDKVCPFSWRCSSDEKDWHVCECHVDAKGDERGIILESFAQDSLYSQFDEVQSVGAARGLNEQLEVGKDKERVGIVSHRTALYFRADMDGFTRRVKEAFDNNNVDALVKEFIAYMKLANDWQTNSKFVTVSPHPWAGDCCNVEIIPVEKMRDKFSAICSSEPQGIVRDWERYVNSHGFSQFSYRKDKDPVRWVYSISGGEIYDFIVETDDRRFKLCVGRPIGRTHAAVNFEENKADYLVMHMEDINALPGTESESFQEYDKGRHPRFKFQTAAMRNKSDSKAAQSAASKAGSATVAGVSLAASRPWTY